ncbi:MAG: hypothetical protein O7C98_03790 [Planctomycetota bacterium]|nr:hypothetical protein [Planctomycetota bacterium]
MPEATPETASDTAPGTQPAAAAARPVVEDRDFQSVLKALLGKTVTIVNPESFETAPMGWQLKEGFYTGRVTGLGRDYMVLQTEITTSRKEGGKQAVKQFIPLRRIKRVSIMKGSNILHI